MVRVSKFCDSLIDPARLECVIFDMDGTLTQPYLDFQLIRYEMQVPEGQDILTWLDSLDDSARSVAESVLTAHELRAAEHALPAEGAIEAVNTVQVAGFKTALLTRNMREAMELVLKRFDLNFDLCFSREDGPIKPEPDSILQACDILGTDPQKSVCIGDWVYDIEAANAAGCISVLLTHGRQLDFAAMADYTIESMTQFAELLKL